MVGATGTIILAGGGDAAASRDIDLHLMSLARPGGKILYVPVAMDGRSRSYGAGLDWLTSTLGALGHADISMWADLAGKTLEDLAPFAAVYIGGGNTFRLLHELRRHAFDRALAEFWARGGVIYGGSAGAIVLGKDIGTCAHLDTDGVGLVGTGGLDLVLGYSIWCHYIPEDAPLVMEYVRARRQPVLALAERAGAHVVGGVVRSVGAEPVTVFADGRHYDL